MRFLQEIQVSIVVIFYNQQHYVERALGSVLRQTHGNLDIVVVDDGSVDNIAPIVHGMQDERIRLFKKENGGAASARNLGVREARNDYIAFLDGDDVFFPTKIERLLSFLHQKDWPVCVITSGHYVISKSGKVLACRNPPMLDNGELPHFSEMYTSCSIYHRDTIERFGGFPEALRINEDGALNARICQEYAIYGLCEALTFYQVDNSGKARKNLEDYDWAISVMENRLSVVSKRCEKKEMEIYRALSELNLLYGFLSVGNISAARRWFCVSKSQPHLTSLSGLLAVVSVRLNLNVYYFCRKVSLWMKSQPLIFVQLRNRHLLRHNPSPEDLR